MHAKLIPSARGFPNRGSSSLKPSYSSSHSSPAGPCPIFSQPSRTRDDRTYNHVPLDHASTTIPPISFPEMQRAPPARLEETTIPDGLAPGVAHLDEGVALWDAQEGGPVTVDDEGADGSVVACRAVGSVGGRAKVD